MPRHQFGDLPEEQPPGKLLTEDEEQEQRSSSPSWDEQEEEIAELVALANAGDDEATCKLLDKFEVYLRRWETLLLYRRFSLTAKDIREFFCLFMRDKSISRRLRASKLDQHVMSEVWRVSNELNHLVTTMMEKEDVWQLLVKVFLHCLNRYRPMERDGKIIPFFRYFYYRFRLELKTELTKLTMDPVFSYGYIELGPTHEYEQDFDALQDDVPLLWVEGRDSTFPFSCLDAHERQVIKWHYRDGLRRKDIAKFMGCSQVLVSNVIRGACGKMQEAMGITAEEWKDWEGEEED